MNEPICATCIFGDLQKAENNRVYKVKTFDTGLKKFKELIQKTEYLNKFAVKEGMIAKINDNYFYHHNLMYLYEVYHKLQSFLVNGEDFERIEIYLNLFCNLYNNFVDRMQDEAYHKIEF